MRAIQNSSVKISPECKIKMQNQDQSAMENSPTFTGSAALWVMDFDRHYPDMKSFKFPQRFTESDDMKLSSGCVSLNPGTGYRKMNTSEVLMLGNMELIHLKDDPDVLLQLHVIDDGLFNWKDNIFTNSFCQVELVMKSPDQMFTPRNVHVQLQESLCKPVQTAKFQCTCGKLAFHISGTLCSFKDLMQCLQQQHYIDFVAGDELGRGLRNGWIIDGRPMYQYMVHVDVTLKFIENKPTNYERRMDVISKHHLETVGRKMLSDTTHMDFKMIVQGKVFPCHKCVLAAQSEVLTAMLESDFSEGQTQEWRIDDMSREAGECFLKFLYSTDSKMIKKEPKLAFELLKAGHKYMVKTLEAFCKELLLSLEIEMLDDQLAFEIFAFASVVPELEELQNKAVFYFKTKGSAIQKSEKLIPLIAENPDVAVNLLAKAYSKIHIEGKHRKVEYVETKPEKGGPGFFTIYSGEPVNANSNANFNEE